ncbi:hypothetical protein Y590_00885 [Methylobacterium sp. AMS5]|nr:hypothetical protein Y590_00885 [Methylobacterium sp. AMS5]
MRPVVLFEVARTKHDPARLVKPAGSNEREG